FIESTNLHRDEILANYGVGPEIMGQTDNQTRANAEASIFVFMRFGVLPFLEKFVDTLNGHYLPAFQATDNMEFAYDDPVPENRDEKRLDAQALFSIGAASPNELRKSFGLEPIDNPAMDEMYLDMTKMPIGTPNAKPPPK
ncbi:MAG: phage portal protein, partial [Acidobacteriota bacterium]|nr:phage portal protein [Acidobacteriota bacterium]